MENNQQLLANRLREVLLNGRWIANTNFKEQITNTSWKEAVCKIEGLNSIAMLTFHINYYLKGILNVCKGGNLDIQDKYSFEMPEIQSEADWTQLVTDFIENATLFANAVAQMDDKLLKKTFVDEKYGSYQRNIEGVIEHSYYHLGQVSLLKKLISKAET
ncbi:MAG: DinB family protein [Bacteroidetes bacterium]|nr:DinB family protein [Bacteroidota bacterium]